MPETLQLRSTLKGHSGWVTSLATSAEIPNMLISSSRDKTILVWDIVRDEVHYAIPRRSLKGHNHFVSDIVLSTDGHYVLSASWDKTLRLWNVDTGVTSHRFVGHTNDVLSVSLSPDNRQVISGSRDKSIKLWNIIGQCKYTFSNGGHSDWVSCVRFSPDGASNTVVSSGWDKVVKVWDIAEFKLKSSHVDHTGYVNTVTISPDGSLCASGGKDGVTMLWDLNEGKNLYSLPAGDMVNALVFSPNRYWLCAATGSKIKVWDLESKTVVVELVPEFDHIGKKSQAPQCISLAWSADGQTLFSGYTDNHIRVWQVSSTLA